MTAAGGPGEYLQAATGPQQQAAGVCQSASRHPAQGRGWQQQRQALQGPTLQGLQCSRSIITTTANSADVPPAMLHINVR